MGIHCSKTVSLDDHKKDKSPPRYSPTEPPRYDAPQDAPTVIDAEMLSNHTKIAVDNNTRELLNDIYAAAADGYFKIQITRPVDPQIFANLGYLNEEPGSYYSWGHYCPHKEPNCSHDHAEYMAFLAFSASKNSLELKSILTECKHSADLGHGFLIWNEKLCKRLKSCLEDKGFIVRNRMISWGKETEIVVHRVDGIFGLLLAADDYGVTYIKECKVTNIHHGSILLSVDGQDVIDLDHDDVITLFKEKETVKINIIF